MKPQAGSPSGRVRLDQLLVAQQLVISRSQAESYIKLGLVEVDGIVMHKAGAIVSRQAKVKLLVKDQYVSRAALKLASVSEQLGITFNDKLVIDAGSSTGGFTDYALRQGARRVIAIELGTDQLHPSLRTDLRIELHEKTDIRSLIKPGQSSTQLAQPTVLLKEVPDIILADISFISIRDILPHLGTLSGRLTDIVVMVKPQFESHHQGYSHHGVIKNDRLRREILKSFELWVQPAFVIVDKADSEVTGAKGNRERFYRLRIPSRPSSR